MFRKIVLSLLILSATIVLHAQQKMKTSDLLGKWQVTALVADGETIPVGSEKGLWEFMTKQMAAAMDSSNYVLSSEDSAAIRSAIQVLSMFSESTLTFNTNKTFLFSLSVGGKKEDKKGTWAFNEAKQTLNVTETQKSKTDKSDKLKILIKGNQLLMQMEEDKEEGFLLSKQ